MFQDIKSLPALVKKADAISSKAKDFIVPAKELTITTGHDRSYLSFNGQSYNLKDRAKRQLAEITSIPYTYYQMLEADYPDLLDNSVNTLINDVGKNKMIRTLGGSARAILSDKYCIFDNSQLLKLAVPLIEESRFRVASCSITEEKMHLKLISPATKAEVKVGDVVNFGIYLSNGELGTAAVQATLFLERKVCSNGLILPEYLNSTRHIHLGKQLKSMADYEEPDKLAISAYIKDSLLKAVDPECYLPVVAKMKEATEIKIPDPMETVTRITKLYALTPQEQGNILFHLLSDRDLSLYGLFNSVTRSAADSTDYTRATYLEEVGSRVLTDGLSAIKRSTSNNLLVA